MVHLIFIIFLKTFIQKKREAVFLNISTTYSENSSALVITSANKEKPVLII